MLIPLAWVCEVELHGYLGATWIPDLEKFTRCVDAGL